MININFDIIKSTILPRNYNYQLFSSIDKIIPIHNKDWIHILPLCNIKNKGSIVEIIPHQSQLKFRIDENKINEIIPLIGKKLSIQNFDVQLGQCHIYEIKPSKNLLSKLVVMKNGQHKEKFKEKLKFELNEMNIDKNIEIIIGKQSSIKIHNLYQIGYQVTLKDLSDQDSLTIQNKGIGAKKHFGCGIFGAIK